MTANDNERFLPDEVTTAAVERKLAELWRDVLQLERLPDPNANFFALGGDSLAMTMLLFQVNEVFGLDLQAPVLADTPELREFSTAVTSAVRGLAQSSESKVL